MTATAIRTRQASAVLHVGAAGPDVILESAALLNASLGDGYIGQTELAELAADGQGILVRARTKRGQLIAAATAAILSPVRAADLQNRLPGPARNSLTGHRIGELKSSAVLPAVRGRGIGTEMLHTRLAFLTAAGCRYAVAASWVSSDAAHSSLGLLERAGFTARATIPGYWADGQGAAGYTCPDCGDRCRCAAVIMILDLVTA